MASTAPATIDAVPYAAVDPHYAQRISALLATPASRCSPRPATLDRATPHPTAPRVSRDDNLLTCSNADAWPTVYDVDTSSAYLDLLADRALEEAASHDLQVAA